MTCKDALGSVGESAYFSFFFPSRGELGQVRRRQPGEERQTSVQRLCGVWTQGTRKQASSAVGPRTKCWGRSDQGVRWAQISMSSERQAEGM